MLPRGRPKKGMTYNTTMQRWEPIPGAQQAKYYQRKKQFQVRVCQPPTYLHSHQQCFEKDRTTTGSSMIDDTPIASTEQQPPISTAEDIVEKMEMTKLRQPWYTAKNIAKLNPEYYVYSLDSDGNFFDVREDTDPYLIKKKQQCSQRFYMKKIIVTGIVHGPNEKYHLEVGEWEQRDDIVKFVKIRY